MKYKSLVVLLWVLHLWIPGAGAQTTTTPQPANTYTLTLQQAFNLAMKSNLELKKSQIALEQAKKKIWETTAMGLPQVNGSVDFTDMVKIPVQMVPSDFMPHDSGVVLPDYIPLKFGTQYGLGLTGTVSQLIFSGEYLVGLQASKVYKQLAEQTVVKTEFDVKQSVMQSYCMILVAKANRQMLQETLDNMNEVLKETEAFYQNGLAEETAVDQIKVLIINVKNGISGMDRQQEVGELLLKYQLGIGLDAKVQLTDNLNSVAQKFSLEPIASTTINFDNLIDYKLMKTNENLLELALKREKSKYLPTLAGFWQYSYKAQGEEFGKFFDGTKNLWFPSSIVGVSMNIPIWSSGERKSRVDQAQMELDKMKLSTQQAKEGIQLQVEQSRTTYNTALDKYYREQENVGLSKKIYDRTLIKVKEGVGTSTDLTQTYNQYLTNQTNFYVAIFELLNAKNSLDRALNQY